MPGNIAQYTSPTDQLHPSDLGERSLVQEGVHTGAFARETGEDYKRSIDVAAGPVASIVDQHDNFQDISQTANAFAATTNNLQKQWNATVQNSDPNDKTIQDKFINDTLEPQLQQLQNAPTTEAGQKWALDRADSLRQHFTTTTAADMSVRAGDAVVKNTVGQLNQLSSTTYQDPSHLDQALDQMHSYYDAALKENAGLLNPKQLSAIDGARQDGANELVKSAIKGYADSDSAKGPDAARSMLESKNYDSLLTTDDKDKLNSYIDNQENSRKVEQQQKAQVQEVQQTAANEQEVKGVFSNLAAGKGYPATQAFSNTKLSTQQQRDLVSQDGILSLPQSFLTSPTYGDKFSQISQSIYSGQPVTAEGLTAGVRRQEITPAGAVQLQQLSDKMKTPEGLTEINAQGKVLQDMRSQIVKGGPNANDPTGEKIYNTALNSFYNAWDAGIKSGKSPAELADPDSKSYVGNIANTFKRTDTQALADVTTAKVPVVALPPADKREVGKTYPTARGDMEWTKDGWLPPKPAVPKPE